MARFMVKASEYKNVCKAVNDRNLAELKKEIIEILKKQDEKDFKKAIDYLESQELYFTHLEKSFNGKWIEKAGYGVGTVRIWKGKKYKKIAPGKWARVFDKEGRGTNIAIGKLIAKVQKIDNVEDLMAFVMQNKQRFVDENGVDLPVLDKLRAAVDSRNGNVGSKGASKPKETDKWTELQEELKEEIRTGKRSNTKELKEDVQEWKNMIASGYYKDDHLEHLKKIVQIGEDELKRRESKNPAEKTKNEESDYVQKKREAKEGYWSDEFKERNMNSIKQRIATMREDGASDKKIKAYLEKTIETNSNDIPWRERAIEEGRIKGNQANDYRDTIQERTVRIENCKELLKEYESETEKPSKKQEKQTKSKFKAFEEVELYFPGEGRVKGKILEDLGDDYYQVQSSKTGYTTNVFGKDLKKIESEESEAEKTQNRSDAMKGNKNAEKGGEDTEDKEQQRINMQLQLLELNKNRQDNNKNIKKLNSKLAELKQKKAEDESRGNSVEKYDKEIKDTQKEIDNLLDDNYSIENKGTKIAKELNAMEKDGVKKSMFDDFVIDMFIDDEIEDEEELKEGETEYNDYSAEQPELFNSVEFAVREALNRRHNCIM